MTPLSQTVTSATVEPIRPAQSPVLLRNYRNLVERTVDVFGDELKASRWLSLPSPDFNGLSPLQAAQKVNFDSAQLEKVFEPIFVRIEHGIDF